jgi:hypothetical protein
MLRGMKHDDSSQSGPPPPGFHWTLVAVLGIVTLGLFGLAWAIVQAVWARKLDPSSKALTLYIVAIVLSLAGAALEAMNSGIPLQAVIQIAAALVATFGAFSVKNSLTAYMVGVEGSPVYLSSLMTLIFGEVYLQYHMNRVRSFQHDAALSNA